MQRENQVGLAFVGAALLAATLSGCANVGTTPAADSQWRSFRASDGAEIHYRYWAGPPSPRAVVQIVHGAAEHSGRYDRFAKTLVSEGYAVYATDHRGHGRTRVRSGALGDAGPDAWNRFIEDEQQLSQLIRQANPGVKLVLFGHSLGSFIAQDYITRRPELIDAVVMSGTAYGPPPPQELIAALDGATKAAPLGPSEFWANLFKDFNKPFTGQPGFEWLSRDAAEVQKYQRDPQAGFPFSNELVRDIFQGFTVLRDPAREARIPKTLPVLVIQGSLDPVGGNLKGTQALLDRYQALGLTRVSHKFYDGARHEVLNETNRDEVTRDVLNWLKAVV
jgi:alpha-beta hydrolase superfamily lysophospholipase